MHKVEIKSKDGKTHVILDGMDISEQCLSYSVSQDAPNGPELTVTLLCSKLDIDAELDSISIIKPDNETEPTFQQKN